MLTAAVVLAGSVVLVMHGASSAQPTAELRGPCPASAVERQVIPASARRAGVPDDVPWVASAAGRITGALFYYRPYTTFSRPRATVGTDGHIEDGTATSILWWVPQAEAPTLTVTGRRLDRPGFFRQLVLGPTSGQFRSDTTFPSTLDVPAAGCWRLTLRNGSVTDSVTFRAIDQRAAT